MRHRFADVAGTTIHWVEAGERTSATPVVLLHGLLDSHLTWTRASTVLARDRLVLMPDLPGHGLSDRPDATYDLTWYARVMAAWLASAELGRVDVVGHSLGGGVAQMLLLECRSRVRRLVLVASGGLGREISLLLRLAAIPLLVERFGQPFLGFGTWLALRNVVDEPVLAALVAMNGTAGSARAFSRTVRDLVDWRGQKRLLGQRVREIQELPPTVVIWGDRDSVIPVKQAAKLLESVDGVQLALVAGSGHWLHNEQPERFTGVVRSFLDASSPPAPSVRWRT